MITGLESAGRNPAAAVSNKVQELFGCPVSAFSRTRATVGSLLGLRRRNGRGRELAQNRALAGRNPRERPQIVGAL